VVVVVVVVHLVNAVVVHRVVDQVVVPRTDVVHRAVVPPVMDPRHPGQMTTPGSRTKTSLESHQNAAAAAAAMVAATMVAPEDRTETVEGVKCMAV